MRLYALLVRAYPIDFKHGYRRLMLQVFRDSCRSAVAAHGVRGVLGLWVRTLGDLATTVPTEHATARRARARARAVQSVTVPTLPSRAAAQLSPVFLNTRAQLVVKFAVTEARAFKHPYIGPEHLVLGLINQPGGSVAAKALDNLGVKLRHARAAVAFIVGVGEEPPGNQPLTATAHRVLAAAKQEAWQLGQHDVGPEHVLLGLAAMPDSVAGGVFELMGISRDMVRAAVMRLLFASEAPDGWVQP